MKQIVLFLQESGVGSQYLHGIGRYASKNGTWRFHRRARLMSPQALARELGSLRIDGILMQLWDLQSATMLREYGVPVINVGNAINDPTIPTIRVDNRLAGRMAAEHFLERGIRNLAGFSMEGHYGFQLRMEGFLERAGQARDCKRFVLRPFRPRENETQEDEIRHYTQVFAELPRPLGVYAITDGQAERLLAAAQQLGRRVPEDIAILGTDNSLDLCELTFPTLSSIDLNLELVGYKAMQLLDNMLQGQAPAAMLTLIPPKDLVLRASTDVLAVNDDNVTKAVRFIREMAHTPIEVDDVMNKLTISRRTLERLFQEHLGHSILQEILAVRMRKARFMLAQSKAPMLDVALKCGFGSQSYFCQAFRRIEGITPSQYRKQAQ